MLAATRVSKVMTLTSTYDHRIIQGAESGLFLKRRARSAARRGRLLRRRVPRRWAFRTSRCAGDETSTRSTTTRMHAGEAGARVSQLINMYRVRGHLLADLDPLGWEEPQPPRARPRHLRLDDLGPRPRVPHRRPFRDKTRAAGRHPRRRSAMRTAGPVGVEYMHISEPDAEAVDPGAGRVVGDLHARRAKSRRTSSTGSTPRKRSSASCTPSTWVSKRFGLEGAESAHPDARRGPRRGRRRPGMIEVVHGDVTPRASQRARQHRRQVAAADLRRVRRRHRPRHHAGLGRREVPPRRDRHASSAASGKELNVSRLGSNPSHLEAVDPVVEGMARAKQDLIGDHRGTSACCPC